jgi:hypothetical protein
VRAAVGGHRGGDVVRPQCVVGRGEGLLDRVEVLVLEPGQRGPHRLGLEELAQAVGLPQLAEVEPGDAVALARGVRDLPLPFEHAQRLPDRDHADAEPAGYLLLADAVARLEAALDDLLPERRGDGLADGRDAHRKDWMPVSAPPMTSECTSAVPS